MILQERKSKYKHKITVPYKSYYRVRGCYHFG